MEVPYDICLKVTLQTTNQLKFLHDMGYIVNDVRLSNQMFSQALKDGFMIDFEDMILENDYKEKPAYYRFCKRTSFYTIPTSQWDDAKKQFICNLSLLLKQNFEIAIKLYSHCEWRLLEQLKVFDGVYDFARQLFLEEKPLYITEISDYFHDKEKILYYKKKTHLNNFEHSLGRKA